MNASLQFLNSQNLIHDEFSIYSVNSFDLFFKSDILKNVQRWKTILLEKNVQKVSIADFVTFDSICVFFASMELGIEIYTTAQAGTAIQEISRCVDIMIISNEVYQLRNPVADNLLVYTESTKDQYSTFEYVPDNIDLNRIAISAFTSGSTGEPKLIQHTAETLIGASQLASSFFKPNERFFTHSNFNHIGVISMGVFGPIIGGTRILTSTDSIYDLMFYAKKRMIDKAAFFEVHLATLKNHNADLRGAFNGIEILTGGKLLTSSFIDWCLSLGAKRIHSIYGATECLPPVMTKTVDSIHVENLSDMGKLFSCYQTKIVDGFLCVKGPGVSKKVESDSEGFYNTGDYVLQYGNTYEFKGRKKISESLHDCDLMILVDGVLSACLKRDLKKFIFPQEYKVTVNDSNIKFDFNNAHDINCIDIDLLGLKLKELGFDLEIDSQKLKVNEIKVV
jgi:long-subunit acyl-CoA synthetase (AMP-forming)